MNGRASLESSTDVSSSPLWLAADLGEEAKMGRVHIRNYKEWSHTSKPSGDVEEKKEEAFTNVSMLRGRLSISIPSPI
jgi:hypothetical protein